MERHTTYRTRLINYRKDGSEFLNDLTFTPLRTDDGHVMFTLAIMDCPAALFDARVAQERR